MVFQVGFRVIHVDLVVLEVPSGDCHPLEGEEYDLDEELLEYHCDVLGLELLKDRGERFISPGNVVSVGHDAVDEDEEVAPDEGGEVVRREPSEVLVGGEELQFAGCLGSGEEISKGIGEYCLDEAGLEVKLPQGDRPLASVSHGLVAQREELL